MSTSCLLSASDLHSHPVSRQFSPETPADTTRVWQPGVGSHRKVGVIVFVGSLVDRLVGSFVISLVSWGVHRLGSSFVISLVSWEVNMLFGSFVRWSSRWSTGWLVHSFVGQLVDRLVDSFIRWSSRWSIDLLMSKSFEPWNGVLSSKVKFVKRSEVRQTKLSLSKNAHRTP